MTDNNADDTDGQNSKLSRRTALALMGTSAVGGSAATSAFSQLTADRPIDVEVVSSGGDAETADSGSSELQVTNNAGTTIDAEITTADSNVQLYGLTGSSSASVSGSNPWTLTGLADTETANIKFEYDGSSTGVSFDVEAFSNTNGFSIGSTQSVTVADGLDASIIHQFDAQALSGSDGDSISTWTDEIGSADASSGTGKATLRSSGINGNQSLEFDGSSSNYTYQFSSTKSQPLTTIVVAQVPTDNGNDNIIIDGYSNYTHTGIDNENDRVYSYAGNLVPASDENDTNPMIITTVWDGDSSVLRKNGSQIGSGNVGSQDLDGVTIGSLKSDERYIDGYIGEARYYDGVLSTDEIEDEEQTLANKWGITI